MGITFAGYSSRNRFISRKSLITYTILYWQLVKVFRGFMEEQLDFRIVYLLAVNSVII